MLNHDIEKMPILIVDWDSSDDEIDKAIQEFEGTDKTVLVVSAHRSPTSIDSDTVSKLVRLLNSDLSLDVSYSLLGLMPDESLTLVRPDRLRELVPQMLYDIPEEDTYKRLALVVDILGNELVYRTVIVNVLAALAYSEQELGLSGVVHCHGRPQRALVIAVDIG